MTWSLIVGAAVGVLLFALARGLYRAWRFRSLERYAGARPGQYRPPRAVRRRIGLETGRRAARAAWRRP